MPGLITHPRYNIAETLYPERVARDAVLRLWDEHLAGADHAWGIGRRVTLEIWLRQVYAGRSRPVGEGAGGLEAGV